VSSIDRGQLLDSAEFRLERHMSFDADPITAVAKS
jgi:hypothetical protein